MAKTFSGSALFLIIRRNIDSTLSQKNHKADKPPKRVAIVIITSIIYSGLGGSLVSGCRWNSRKRVNGINHGAINTHPKIGIADNKTTVILSIFTCLLVFELYQAAKFLKNCINAPFC
jgi:hypothetical protein